jgi:hypothetical protein
MVCLSDRSGFRTGAIIAQHRIRLREFPADGFVTSVAGQPGGVKTLEAFAMKAASGIVQPTDFVQSAPFPPDQVLRYRSCRHGRGDRSFPRYFPIGALFGIETESELTRGMTVVDRLNVADDQRNRAVWKSSIAGGHKAKILWTIDNARWKQALYASLR